MAESTVGLDEGSTTTAGAITDGSGNKVIKHLPCHDNGSAVPVNTSEADPLPTQDPGFGTVGDGSKNVTLAGTAVQLHAGQACRKVIISVNDGNTGKRIYVGGSGVSSTSGMFIYSGEKYEFNVTNLNLLYLDSDENGDGVTYTYFS